MSTEQYAMVRGRVIRVTKLSAVGGVLDEPGQYVVSNCITKVGINEIVDAGSNDVIRDSNEDPMLHFVKETEILGHTADINFLKVDPGVLELVSGNPPVYDWTDPEATIGFDQMLRTRANTAFALEVWSKIANRGCGGDEGFGEAPFGESFFGGGDITQRWGYTIFPFLKGGYLGGFEFANSTVTFQLKGAQSRWGTRWGIGPFDLIDGLRQPSAIRPRTSWRNFIYLGTPPQPTIGIQNFTDVIDGGTASLTTSDILDGGSASSTTSGIVEGGPA
jgi:hypothetical protein